jgi:hypothetical protein
MDEAAGTHRNVKLLTCSSYKHSLKPYAADRVASALRRRRKESDPMSMTQNTTSTKLTGIVSLLLFMIVSALPRQAFASCATMSVVPMRSVTMVTTP